MRWTRQRFARDGIAGLVERLVSDQQHADERCFARTAKSCGPDAPTLASSSRSCVGPTGLRQNLAPRMTVAKEPGHRGERDISRKTIACGNAGRSGVLVVTRVRSTNTKCTRDRGCSGHPAFPTPFCFPGRKIHQRLGRTAPRDREVVSGIRAPSLRAKRSNPFFLFGKMDCFALNDGPGCLKIESGNRAGGTFNSSCANPHRREPARLTLPADFLCKRVAQADGPVEHWTTGRRILVVHEIALPLELH